MGAKLNDAYPIEIILQLPKATIYYLFTLLSLVDFSDGNKEKLNVVISSIKSYLVNFTPDNEPMEDVVKQETEDIIESMNILRQTLLELSKPTIDKHSIILQFSNKYEEEYENNEEGFTGLDLGPFELN